MDITGSYKIRPAARLLLTIGSDLIKDKEAAVIELVKNAYDADACCVRIEIRKKNPEQEEISIVILDDGHGMTRKDVIDKWMVPSTNNKQKQYGRESPKGRFMQGNKGVGRYAASALGEELMVKTVTADANTTEFSINWGDCIKEEYLEDIDIQIKTKMESNPQGTQLAMIGCGIKYSWSTKQIKSLRVALMKMKLPLDNTDEHDDEFRIFLKVDGIDKEQSLCEEIRPFPVFDKFDYKIEGEISENGKGVLEYSERTNGKTSKEVIQFDHCDSTKCGDLGYEIYVYDLDREHGLKDYSGVLLGKSEEKKTLKSYSGVGVYQNGFRVRPLGELSYDWLDLNKRRVNNPTMCISSNQVIGHVTVQEQEKSWLCEKSARDGFIESIAYDKMKDITIKVIRVLERRRWESRRKVNRIRQFNLLDNLGELQSLSNVRNQVESVLHSERDYKKIIEKLNLIIIKEEKDKRKIAKDINMQVAKYYDYATLGKIIDLILHEGRSPLNCLNTYTSSVNFWLDEFRKTKDPSVLDELVSIVGEIKSNVERFVKLFSKLDPLASRTRSQRKMLLLKGEIRKAVRIFEEKLISQHVSVDVTGPDDFKFLTWLQDIPIIFTNLIENSLYWMQQKNTVKRRINIELVAGRNTIHRIDYRDTGPGIDSKIIDMIFDAGFTTKPTGTGLGLTIAAETAIRNNLKLTATSNESGSGCYFVFHPNIRS